MLISYFSENSSQDYGITPEYICKRNEDVKRAQEEYDNYIQENLKKAAMKRLSDEEREAVLQVSLPEFAPLSLSRQSPINSTTEARALKCLFGSSKSAQSKAYSSERERKRKKKPVVQRFLKYFISDL